MADTPQENAAFVRRSPTGAVGVDDERADGHQSADQRTDCGLLDATTVTPEPTDRT